MDVISLHRAGFAAAVAPLGTALTEFQLNELWRLSPEPILCFDGDAAGQRAAARALRRALPMLRPGQSLRFARLPAGEDPDSIVRTAGPAAFAEILTAAQPMSSMLWEIESGGRQLDTPERRADLDHRLMEAVGLIADRTVQTEYRRFVRNQLFEQSRLVRIGTSIAARLRPRPIRDGPEPAPRSGPRIQREKLLRLVLSFPWLVEEVAEQLAAIDIPE